MRTSKNNDIVQAYLADLDIKSLLLNDINSSSLSRQAKDKIKREERKAERERLAKYKAEQQAEADKARKERLQSLKK